MRCKRIRNNVIRPFVLLMAAVSLFNQILISPVYSKNGKEWPISSEKAFEIFNKWPEIKSIGDKNFQARMGTSTGFLSSPVDHAPFYIFFSDTTQCIPIRPDACEEKTVERRLFYINADTGIVYSQEEAQVLIEDLRQIEIARRKAEADQLEQSCQEFERQQGEGGQILFSVVDRNKSVFLKALTSLTPDIRERGVRILGEVLRKCPLCKDQIREAVPSLVNLLKDSSYGMRSTAAMTLESLAEKGDAGVIAALQSLLMDENELVRRTAIQSLMVLADAPRIPDYIELLNDPEMAQAAVDALARKGDGSAVKPLRWLFYDKRFPYLERSIVRALGDIHDASAVPFLIALLDNKYTIDQPEGYSSRTPMIGSDAAAALVKIGEPAIPSILTVLRSGEKLSRLYALLAVTLMKKPDLCPVLREVLLLEKDPLVRIYLQRAIAICDGQKFRPSALDSLELSVQSEKPGFTQNDPINFYWILKNAGQEPVIINSLPVKEVSSAFKVNPLDGQASGFERIVYDKMSYSPRLEDLVTIAPGESYRAGPFNLKEDFDLVLPGRYAISGSYYNYFPAIEHGVYAIEGQFESEAVTIEVYQK